MIVRQVVYFEQTGPQNTEATLSLARERAETLGISKVLVATSTGETALKAAQVFAGKQVIVVVRPYRQDHQDERLDPAAASRLRALGCTLLTPEQEHPDVRALRAFGTGAKVACEIAVRAAEAGLVSPEEEVVAIAGSHSGADTVLVLQPATEVRRICVRELVCKPR